MSLQGILEQAGSLVAVGAMTVAVVALVLLVNAWRADRRKKLRRLLTVYGVYLASVALSAAVQAGMVSRALNVASDLLQALAVVALASTALFEVALPLVRIRVLDLTADLVTGAAYLVVTAAVLSGAGLDFTSVLAASTVMAAVLTISLQSTLGNLVGGLALQLEGSVRVGDWVQFEGGRVGRVASVRWRHAELETRDGDTIIVPNALLLQQSFTLLGRHPGAPVRHRQWVHFNVDFRASPREVVRVVEEAIRASPIPHMAADPPPDVVCVDLARDSWATYAVRYWLTDLMADAVADSVVRARVHAALRRARIPLARPSHTQFQYQEGEGSWAARESARQERALAALKGVDLFSSLTDTEVRDLARHLWWCPFDAGEVITRQGAVAHWLYILHSGTVEVVTEVEGAAPRVVSTIEAPGFFGEMGLLTGEPRLASVIAVIPVVCYRLDKRDFERVLTRRPEIADDLSPVLAHRRVELLAVRENLDAAARAAREHTERARILGRIREFFGLG